MYFCCMIKIYRSLVYGPKVFTLISTQFIHKLYTSFEYVYLFFGLHVLLILLCNYKFCVYFNRSCSCCC